jgi:hypothetical protein
MFESMSANQEVLARAQIEMRETLDLEFGPSRMKRAAASLSGPKPNAKRHRPEDSTPKTAPRLPYAPSSTPHLKITTSTSTPSRTPLRMKIPRFKSPKEIKEDYGKELKELKSANYRISERLLQQNLEDEAQLAEDHKQQEAQWRSFHRENEEQWAKEHRAEEAQLAKEQQASEEVLEKSMHGFNMQEQIKSAKKALDELAIATGEWDKNHAGYENALRLQQELASLVANVKAQLEPDNSSLI